MPACRKLEPSILHDRAHSASLATISNERWALNDWRVSKRTDGRTRTRRTDAGSSEGVGASRAVPRLKRLLNWKRSLPRDASYPPSPLSDARLEYCKTWPAGWSKTRQLGRLEQAARRLRVHPAIARGREGRPRLWHGTQPKNGSPTDAHASHR